jgi:aryl-alcohol dehydrogenase-like predicted oxidoreductase
VGVLVWSPLAGGLLSGKFRRDEAPPEGTRRSMIGDLGIGPVDENHAYAVVDAARAVAHDRGVSMAQVALNWLRARPEVSSIVIGARTPAQLADNLAAVQWQLEPAELAVLDQASTRPLPYPYWYHRQFGAERYAREPEA